MAAKFQYARLARTAQRLIDRFGISEKLEGFVDGVPDPARPNRPPVRTPFGQDVNAVFLDIDTKLIDGTLIKTGDMKVLLSPGDVTIPLNLTGTISRSAEDEVWSIVNCRTLNPGGIKLLYTLQVRR